MFRARHYLTTYAGLVQPWRNLLTYVPDLTVRSRLFGTGYLAHGRFRAPHAALDEMPALPPAVHQGIMR